MRNTRDIKDYVRRLLVAILLCPVAAGVWLVFALSGFSFDSFLAYLGTLSQQYAAMSPDEQGVFRFQVFAVWGVMAFGFLFLTFVVSPPHFKYRLKKEGEHWSADVVEE